MSRFRHISSKGDAGTSSQRTAATGPASATVFIGGLDGARPNRNDPSITLLVDEDGVYQLVAQGCDGAAPHILTTGHVDDLGDAA